MTNAQLYDLILQKCRRSGDLTLRAVIASELRGMLNSLEHSPFHPWFLERTSSGLVTVAGTETVAMPSDFLLLVEDTKVWAIHSDGSRTKLTRAYHEDLEESAVDTPTDVAVDPARPTHFDYFADQLFLFPIPDDVYTIRMKYYATTTPPPDNATEVSNPWVLKAEDFFVVNAAQRLVQNYIKDFKLSGELAAEASMKRSELHKYNEARKHSEMDYRIDR